jgi:hypothetical protein
MEKGFYGCELLKVVIPEWISVIGEEAFYGCELLSDITISKGVTEIGSKAFFKDWNIHQNVHNHQPKVYKVLATNPPKLGTLSFGEVDDSFSDIFIVPAGYGDIYKNAEGWSYYADYITEATE